MKRSDFLGQLKSALEHDMNAQEVKENVDYYNEYIQNEIRSGKSEQEVLDMLGDPWAIAKTILMSSGGADAKDVQEKKDSYQEHAKVHVFGLDSWWKKVAAIGAVIAIISIIMSIVMGIIRMIMPIAIPVLVVLLIVKIWKK